MLVAFRVTPEIAPRRVALLKLEKPVVELLTVMEAAEILVVNKFPLYALFQFALFVFTVE